MFVWKIPPNWGCCFLHFPQREIEGNSWKLETRRWKCSQPYFSVFVAQLYVIHVLKIISKELILCVFTILSHPRFNQFISWLIFFNFCTESSYYRFLNISSTAISNFMACLSHLPQKKCITKKSVIFHNFITLQR